MNFLGLNMTWCPMTSMWLLGTQTGIKTLPGSEWTTYGIHSLTMTWNSLINCHPWFYLETNFWLVVSLTCCLWLIPAQAVTTYWVICHIHWLGTARSCWMKTLSWSSEDCSRTIPCRANPISMTFHPTVSKMDLAYWYLGIYIDNQWLFYDWADFLVITEPMLLVDYLTKEMVQKLFSYLVDHPYKQPL